MKLKLFTIVILCLIAVSKSIEEEYEYEDEAAPAPVTAAPTKPTSRLGGLLSPRNRSPAAKKTAQASTTTAKTVEHTEEEVEGEEGFEENQEQEEAPVVTTEASKKIKGGVRPFRSNEDLLAALKRRRAQVGLYHSKEQSSTHAPVESTSTSSKYKSASNGRSKSNANGEVGSKPTSRGRFGTSRGSKPVQEEVEETQHDEVQVKPKPYRSRG